jgi:hypothetical protein
MDKGEQAFVDFALQHPTAADLIAAVCELYSELGSAYARQSDIARSQAAFQHAIEIDTSTHAEVNTDGEAKPDNSPGAFG